MARRVARIIPARLRFSSSVITADVLEAQVATAGGLLQWLHAKAREARETWRAAGILSLVVGLMGWILREVQKKGVENFDPPDYGSLAHAFRGLGATIRRLGAAGDSSGLADRFACRRLFRRLRVQAQAFSQFADRLSLLDQQWQEAVSRAAEERIRQERDAMAAEGAWRIPEMDEPSEPSDDAIRAQLIRTVTAPLPPRG